MVVVVVVVEIDVVDVVAEVRETISVGTCPHSATRSAPTCV